VVSRKLLSGKQTWPKFILLALDACIQTHREERKNIQTTSYDILSISYVNQQEKVGRSKVREQARRSND
jgi:hypothetical protein